MCNVWPYPHFHSRFHPLFCKSPAVDCRRDCQVSHGSRAVLSITSSSRARKDSNRGHRSSPARSAGAGEKSNPGSRSGGKTSVRHVGQLLGDLSHSMSATSPCSLSQRCARMGVVLAAPARVHCSTSPCRYDKSFGLLGDVLFRESVA